MPGRWTTKPPPRATPTAGQRTSTSRRRWRCLHFVERQADAAILEVGLGGRLDSTNVCLPVVSVITSISFDHMRQLGNTLAAIAREKAGIIKPGVPVICGVTEPEPQEVIADVAREHGCRLIQLGRDFQVRYRSPVEERQGDKETRRQGDQIAGRSLSPCLPLSLSNSTSTIDFEYLVPGQELAIKRTAAGDARQASGRQCGHRPRGRCGVEAPSVVHIQRRNQAGPLCASLPGRVEVMAGDPLFVLDTAHNPASARALVETLAELPAAARRTLIVSISSDKDVPAVVRELVPHFDRIIVTQYQDNPRAVPADQLLDIFRHENSNRKISLSVCSTPREAFQFATESAVPGECISVAGSFFLAAEMRPYLLHRQAAETSKPEIRL